MLAFPAPLSRLIGELKKLPGIGSRSAQRLALHLVARPPADLGALAAALESVRDEIRRCSRCHHITDIDPCETCEDPSRDHRTVCVVEHPSDVLAVEASSEYRGLYHVLHGVLDPLAGIGPEQLTVDSLLQRTATTGFGEVILATGASVEGEATAAYLAEALAARFPDGLAITRPAQGMPAGGEVEYTDRLTLARALKGRRPLS